MPHINIEIKARCGNQHSIREILRSHNADFIGTDHQVDTYFRVPNGRLKLREGTIEHALIHYERENIAGPKLADIILYKPAPDPALKAILSAALGILAVVDKKREIYFIGNVKFHLDTVEKLGSFVEIEAIDAEGNIGMEKLYEQCRHYLGLFGIAQADLLENSYSDMLMNAGTDQILSK